MADLQLATEPILEVWPEAGHWRYRCLVPGCKVYMYAWIENGRDGMWKQHGENPEHRQFLGGGESGYAWSLKVHGYEDA